MKKSLVSFALAAGVSLTGIATATAQSSVTYEFNRTTARFTDGTYLYGQMTATFPVNPTSTPYATVNGAFAVYAGGYQYNLSLFNLRANYYTNVLNCGTRTNIYEYGTSFAGADGRIKSLYLDFNQNSSRLLPGDSGVYTSWNDGSGAAPYRLVATCADFNASRVQLRAQGIVATIMQQAAQNMGMFFNGLQSRMSTLRFKSNRNFRRFFGAGDEDSGDGFAPWIQPIGTWARQSDNNGMTPYTSNSGGFSLGVDGNYNENIIVGGAFTFLRTSTDINVTLPSKMESDTYNFSLYGRYSLTPEWGATAMVSYGHISNKNKRAIDSAISGYATSSFGTDVFGAKVGLERDFGVVKDVIITPSIALAGYYVNNGGYTEAGDDLGVTVRNKSSNALTADANLRAMYKATEALGIMANVGASYDLVQGSVTVSAAPILAPTDFVAVTGQKLPPWAFQAGAGLFYNITKQTMIGAQYGVELRTGYQNNAGSLNLRIAF